MPLIKIQAAKRENALRIFKLIHASKDHLQEWLPWINESEEMEDTLRFIINNQNKDFYSGRVIYEIHHNKSIIGLIDLHGGNKRNKSVDIGYWLGAKYIGKGYMTMACKQLIDIVFDTTAIQVIKIKCAEGNLKSRAIPVRLGFSCAGIHHKKEKINGKSWPLVVYVMEKKNWPLQKLQSSPAKS